MKGQTLKENKVNAENSLNKITVSITECESEIEKISGSRSKLTEEHEAMSEKLQNIKLEILTFEKDISFQKRNEIKFHSIGFLLIILH